MKATMAALLAVLAVTAQAQGPLRVGSTQDRKYGNSDFTKFQFVRGGHLLLGGTVWTPGISPVGWFGDDSMQVSIGFNVCGRLFCDIDTNGNEVLICEQNSDPMQLPRASRNWYYAKRVFHSINILQVLRTYSSTSNAQYVIAGAYLDPGGTYYLVQNGGTSAQFIALNLSGSQIVHQDISKDLAPSTDAEAFAPDGSGNFYVVLRASQNLYTNPPSGNRYVRKISSTGQVLWTYLFDSLDAGAAELAVTPNGSPVVATDAVEGAGPGYPGSNYTIHYINSSGAQVWQASVNDTTQYHSGLGVDAGGNVYIPAVSGNTGYFSRPYIGIAKYSASGTLLWQSTCTHTYPNEKIVFDQAGFAYALSSDFITKYTLNGGIAWERNADVIPDAALFNSNGDLFALGQNVFGILGRADLITYAQAPVTVADSYTVSAGSTLTVGSNGVLGNDLYAGNASVSVVQNVSNGVLKLNANGSFTYTPAAGFTGTDTFTYVAAKATMDGTVTSDPATVTITVQ